MRSPNCQIKIPAGILTRAYQCKLLEIECLQIHIERLFEHAGIDDGTVTPHEIRNL
jgi:hypothetical protein